jgi:Rieske Fe-S protein
VCGCIAASSLLGGCATMAARPVPMMGDRVRLALADHPELAQAGGAIKILPSGMREPLYVLALDGGGYAVLSPKCTHRECTVDIQGARLVCPCHGSTFDREGKVLRGPAERPLARYEASVADGLVDIRIGAVS